METLTSVSDDALGLILKRLDVSSATNLLISNKATIKKVPKYIYPRFWFDYKDLKKGKYKKINYIYIHKIKNVTDLDILKEFRSVRKIKFNNNFNQNLDQLPLSLKRLTCIIFEDGSQFNQKLPSTVKVIFGSFKKIKGVIGNEKVRLDVSKFGNMVTIILPQFFVSVPSSSVSFKFIDPKYRPEKDIFFYNRSIEPQILVVKIGSDGIITWRVPGDGISKINTSSTTHTYLAR